MSRTPSSPNYDAFLEARGNLGTDGVQLAVVDRSPFQKTLIELCGTERLHFDFLEMPEVVDELLEALACKQDEAYRIVAEFPAEVVWMVDNVTGDITEPRMFEKHCVPFYNRQARLLHDAGKLLAVHFDGRMRPLKDLIACVGPTAVAVGEIDQGCGLSGQHLPGGDVIEAMPVAGLEQDRDDHQGATGGTLQNAW